MKRLMIFLLKCAFCLRRTIKGVSNAFQKHSSGTRLLILSGHDLVDCVHPFPGGFYGDSLKPYISASAVVMKYQKRRSGPVLDCIGIHIEVPRVD
jgi:hypothetical protein